jgi:hypothetical protein
MQEINRGLAHLGSKTQECNTRAKQNPVPACVIAGTIGLLCGHFQRRPLPGRDGLTVPDGQLICITSEYLHALWKLIPVVAMAFAALVVPACPWGNGLSADPANSPEPPSSKPP